MNYNRRKKMEKDKPEELGEIKYSGLMPDGTRYELTLDIGDRWQYEKISKALEKEAAGHAMSIGLMSIMTELESLYWKKG